jgi:hypothetical protein
VRRTLPSLDPEIAKDVAYPPRCASDPVFPCRTLEPIGSLLSGVTAPGIWSRLESPLDTALTELWAAAGFGAEPGPNPWVSVHYGRIVLNAHGWEILRAVLQGEAPDPALAPPSPGWIARLLDRARARAAPLWRRRVRALVRRSVRAADHAISNSSEVPPLDLDLFELARGPLDDLAWTRILVPWLAERLLEHGDDAAEMRTARALALERRFTRALGERLLERGALERPEDAAYLTVEERLAAVNDPAGSWALHLESRIERVRSFDAMQVPSVFWGTPELAS